VDLVSECVIQCDMCCDKVAQPVVVVVTPYSLIV
jgi:hypothetical protein